MVPIICIRFIRSNFGKMLQPSNFLGAVSRAKLLLHGSSSRVCWVVFVLTTCWCPRIESCLVLLLKGVFYDDHVLLTKLCLSWPFFTLHYKAKLAYYSGYLVIPPFAFQFFMMKRKSFPCIFFLVLDIGGLVGLHRTGQLQQLWQ